MAMKIVINADDLGISRQVNDAVFELMRTGRITSGTLLANGPAVEDAAARSKGFPNRSFGAHLNLTEFRPITTGPELSPLLDDRGEFAGNLRDVRLTTALKQGIHAEWRAQLCRLQELGVAVSHLASQPQVHTLPALVPVLKRLQAEFGLRRVRLTKNWYAGGNRPAMGRLAAKGFWNFLLRHWYRTRTTTAFTSFEDFLAGCQSSSARWPSVELMAHPGSSGFALETSALGGDWQARLPFAIELVSYHSI